MSDHNNEDNEADSNSPRKMQNAQSQGADLKNQKFNYQREEVVDAVRAYFQFGGSAKAKLAAVLDVYKHFYRHAGELAEVCEILGTPPKKGESLLDGVWRRELPIIMEIIMISEHSKPLKFFISELWGVSFKKERASLNTLESEKNLNGNSKEEGGRSLSSADNGVELIDSELVYEGRDAIKQLRQILSESSEDQRALTHAEVTSFVSAFAGATKAAVDQTREYLETMLLIGAGVLFMRFQRRLLDVSEYKSLDQKIKTSLRGHLKSVSESAFKSTLGRISRAYRHALSVHMGVGDLQLSDHARLWEFYQNSLPEIPRLVDKYIAGGFDYRHLNGIPFLPKMGEEKEKATKSKPLKADWEEHLRLLKVLFRASEGGYLGEFVRTRGKSLTEDVDATLFGIEKIKEFYELLDGLLNATQSVQVRKEVCDIYEIVQNLDRDSN